MFDLLSLNFFTSVFLLAETKSFWLDPNSYIAILKVALGLGFVIFIHELGHFLVAKACGVKCDKFYVGFDAFDIKIGDTVIIPRTLLSFQWGETEYGLGILPLGGYVKMMGQDDNPTNQQEELARSKQGGMPDNEEAATMAATGISNPDQHDPRSFLAKSVVQRMAIISAGVIFNLVSAIFFAAFAFKSGVSYTPPTIGKVIGGGPGWVGDLAGSEVLRIGDRTIEGYFTQQDLLESFALHGDKEPIRLQYQRLDEDQPREVDLMPRRGLIRAAKNFTLAGLQPLNQPTLGKPATFAGHPADRAVPPFQSGDVIKQINGVDVNSTIDLFHVLLRDANLVTEFVVERPAPSSSGTRDDTKPKSPPQTVHIQVDPNPDRRTGILIKWGKILFVQDDSPAATAGLKPGDQIVAINGETRGDLLTLDYRLIQMAKSDQTVELEIFRGDSLKLADHTAEHTADQNTHDVDSSSPSNGRRANQTEIVRLQPRVPRAGSALGEGQPLAIDAIGVAIGMTLELEGVDSDSPASEAGLQAGDQIVSVRYLLDKQQREEFKLTKIPDKPINLKKEDLSWAEIHQLFQQLPEGLKFELEVRRGEETVTVELVTTLSNEVFQPTRGITLIGQDAFYAADAWQDAFYYGALQVWRDVTKVGKVLGKLLRNEISPFSLGGPGTIAIVATSEASQGTSRLLLFLTFLSANLAIVNLLPIPILDGGHLLFLAYEGIFRRPVDERMQLILSYIGLAMLLSLMAFVLVLDIGRISSLFFM